MARIVVLGAGFAGLWAAAGAARKLAEIGARPGEVEILVIDRNPYHNIRVRNYESDLSTVAIPLTELLHPIGVRHATAEVEHIDPTKQQAIVVTTRGRESLAYDRLVVALGSELARERIIGPAEVILDVDTYAAAVRLNDHIAALGARPASQARSTAVVVGAGFTGIEVATEMPGKLSRALAGIKPRVILVDPNPVVGATIGDQARPVICEALSALGVETRLGAKIAVVDATGVTLASGEMIPAATVVWCAGMRASLLAAALPGTHDRLGRLAVDEFMRVQGLTTIFAAGDVAVAMVDGIHATVMSCQFARPMGRFAGHNIVADLFGLPMLPLRIDWYVTVLDLGPWGALYTRGWDRQVWLTRQDAKTVKETINHKRIYPPRSGSREDILAAAAPVVQPPPQYRGAAATG
jgi:NADH dehydrogenase